MDLTEDNDKQLIGFLRGIRDGIKLHREMEAKVIAEMTKRGMAVPASGDGDNDADDGNPAGGYDDPAHPDGKQ